MDIKSIGQQVKNMHPGAYDDLDDAQVGSMFLQKHGSNNQIMQAYGVGDSIEKEQKEFAGTDAKAIAAAQSALRSVDRIEKKLSNERTGKLTEGKLDLFGASTPLTPFGRGLESDILNLSDAILRGRTGAAAPEEEVKRYAKILAPSPLDPEDVKRQKLDASKKELLDILTNMGVDAQEAMMQEKKNDIVQDSVAPVNEEARIAQNIIGENTNIREVNGAESKSQSSFSDLPGNIIPSAIKNVSDLADALLHPIETSKNIATLTGVGTTPIAGLNLPTGERKSKQMQMISGLKDFYKDRYGSVDNARETIIEDPVGVALDMASVLSMYGAGAKASNIGKASRAGKIGATLDPAAQSINVVNNINSKLARLGIKGLNKLDDVAKDIPIRGIRVSPTKQVQFADETGKTMAQFIDDNKLTGNPIKNAKELVEKKQASFDTFAKNADLKIDNKSVIDAFDKRINDLTTGGNAANPQMQKIAKELENYKNLFKKSRSTAQSGADELTKIRQSIDETVNSKNAWNVDPELAAASVQARRTYQSIIRENAKRLPGGENLTLLGNDLRDLYKFLDYTKRTESVANKSRLMNALKIGYGGSMVATGNIPALIMGVIVDYLASNPRALSLATKGTKASVDVAKKALEIPPRLLESIQKLEGGARNVGVPLIPTLDEFEEYFQRSPNMR